MYLKSDYRIGFTMKRRYKLSIQLICFDCFYGLGDAEEVDIQKCLEFGGKLQVGNHGFFAQKDEILLSMLTEVEFKVIRGLRTDTGDYTIGEEKSLLVPK